MRRKSSFRLHLVGIGSVAAVLVIVVMSSAVYFITSQRQGTKMAPNEGWSLPQEDVSGFDFPDVPRYPGAVRVYYTSGNERDNMWISPPRPSATYAVEADIWDVIDFYSTEMDANEWVLTSSENYVIETTCGNSVRMSFTFEKELDNFSMPARAVCRIVFERNYQGQSNVVCIHISYHETWWI